jgi:N-acetylglucosamine kinase-like BadF-type ATPase
MNEIKLIADSGATNTKWCLLKNKKSTIFQSQGISPYLMDSVTIEKVLKEEVLPHLKKNNIDEVYFYGTGCKSPVNANKIKKAIQKIIIDAKVSVDHDLMGATKSSCKDEKGIACILGTGSNSCYYNGKKIIKNSPGLGFILGDEGSGAYLGKKIIQHLLYEIFDKELQDQFFEKYKINGGDILESVYRKPLPNRYLASFVLFLAENRGHYMIENIIEDGLNDFFLTHIIRYRESTKVPIHFTGGIAFGFKEVIKELCEGYGLQLGGISSNPMKGLIEYHSR